jgi:hypothetical protein
VLLVRKIRTPFKALNFGLMIEPRVQPPRSAFQQVRCSVDARYQPEARKFKRSFIESRRHELSAAVETSSANFIIGDRAGNDCSVGKQKSSAWSQDSCNFAKHLCAVTKVKNGVDGDDGIEAAAVKGHGLVQVGFKQSDQVLQPMRSDPSAPGSDRLCVQVHAAAVTSDPVYDED